MFVSYIFFFFIIAFVPSPAFAGAHEIAFPLWTTGFFAILILSIAFMPLINGEWWGKYYKFVSLGLALPVVWIVGSRDFTLILETLTEYLSFIILLGSLFVIAGGIVIRTSVRGGPVLNVLILGVGAIFASIIGTTGSSMVLIRPLIRANKWRRHVAHIFIFFIFLVSNIGGLLTPLGDPPLFLGFLKGVPFTWTLRLIPFWLFALSILIGLFYVLDRHFLKKDLLGVDSVIPNRIVTRRLEIRGKINFLFLAAVVGAFFLPPVAREIVMIGAAISSIYLTPVVLREENAFTYHPIIEVAVLFAGIFVAMIPAIKILEMNGGSLGVNTSWKFFWMSGILSSFLDNAPTYLVFMSTAKSIALMQHSTTSLVAGVPEAFLMAISVGSVFMGANTYVGNGPNFMVKAICEENDISMPSFFGYIVWSFLFLIPVFILVTFIFFL